MKKIHLSTESLKGLLAVATDENVTDDIFTELHRRELIDQIQAELKSGKGFYGHRPEYAKKERENLTRAIDSFSDAAFDWIVAELDWTYSEHNRGGKD